MTEELLSALSDGVRTLTLNRPARRNALTDELMEELRQALVGASEDDDVRVVVLTGAGESFCSGADFSMMHRELPADRGHPMHDLALAASRLPKPLIAAVNGPAVGAGAALALTADIRLLSARASVAEGYINVGLFPGAGDPFFLPRLVGTANALLMFWTGDAVDADECVRIGLAQKVFAAESFAGETDSFARRLAGRPQTAIRAVKRAIRETANRGLQDALPVLAELGEATNASPERAEEYKRYAARRASEKRMS